MDDFTRKFDFVGEQDAEIHRIMLTVYQALEEKGYNPVNQIVGYILSEDPTYITNHHQARTLIRKVDRDELLQILVRNYLSKEPSQGRLFTGNTKGVQAAAPVPLVSLRLLIRLLLRRQTAHFSVLFADPAIQPVQILFQRVQSHRELA